jgi:hypothetical protein
MAIGPHVQYLAVEATQRQYLLNLHFSFAHLAAAHLIA